MQHRAATAIAEPVGLTRKANATCEKLAPPVAPDSMLIGSARRQPSRPPTSARNADSIMNELRIDVREKPSARSVPISRVRAATSAYIVFIAPNTAPMPMMTPTNSARAVSVVAVWPGLLLVVLQLARPSAAACAGWPCSSASNASSVDGSFEPHRQRLVAAGPVEGRRQRVVVAPDLALEAAALRREDADHLPVLPLQLDAAARPRAPW